MATMSMRRASDETGIANKSSRLQSWFSVIGLVGLLSCGIPAYGQNALIQSPAGAVPSQSRLTRQNDGVNGGLTIHRDPLGRPCLKIEAASRAEAVNPRIFDHIVSVYNRCMMRIKLSVCYYKSYRCLHVDVPGNHRKDVVLGIFPDMRFFRFSYKEDF